MTQDNLMIIIAFALYLGLMMLYRGLLLQEI